MTNGQLLSPLVITNDTENEPTQTCKNDMKSEIVKV